MPYTGQKAEDFIPAVKSFGLSLDATSTPEWDDDEKLVFGTDSDFAILWDSSNAYLELQDVSGNELVTLTAVASAVNELNITNNSTGAGPVLEATGETNVDLQLKSKGSGLVKFATSGNWTAIGSGTASFSSTLPASTNSTITAWLTVKDNSGNTGYVPWFKSIA